MYVMVENQLTIYDFVQPFGAALDPENRWVKLADTLDWQEMEEKYADHFGRAGIHALPLRMAFSSLVIRRALNLSDTQTLQLICESPYLQYFIGLRTFTNEPPFSPHSMAAFRRRIPQSRVDKAVRLLKKLSRQKKQN